MSGMRGYFMKKKIGVVPEHPIIFSGPMVRAILENRKTQTRRVCVGQRELSNVHDFPLDLCPYGQPGNRLWVRETWRAHLCAGRSSERIHYAADGSACPIDGEIIKPWRPSIFMPRWASRITLEITGIRVQRLQEIQPEQCVAEGVVKQIDGTDLYSNAVSPGYAHTHYPQALFHKLWDAMNAKRGFAWYKNPWVWSISFRRITLGRVKKAPKCFDKKEAP